ncbi:GH3 auxin-responsive promoter family protein [Rufibacter sediminis]|uniref:GH3 auxin-responsive promoter family protein n=1 Tax=Rufibacter sediminis TaxID=2762756 RepID=A0ABR6VWP8_9BACT|nr:GH3 auxin-responsive promoter family protein [Rufibacter sediminis]MBC3541312.1 GH3 auxin-responsive promoter family protein [Rufibacter sediminis]
MGIKAFLSKPLAAWVHSQQQSWMERPAQAQQQVFKSIIGKAANTAFGKDHYFKDIQTPKEFAQAVPVRDYETLRPYFDRLKQGERDVLWPGLPLYFAKTSGTTSGTKYIPITQDSIPNHINGAKNALLNYIQETGRAQFLDGKLIFLSGSPVLEQISGINTGRLSGIVNHHVPAYLRTNQLPSYDTNCIEDWETKLDAIVQETLDQRMTLISGIPPWVQMYFDKIMARTGKQIKDVFPDFNLFVYGGVNFAPYRAKLYESIGRKIDSIETFPASEGFIAFQNTQEDPSLLLLADSGIFFEFIPAEEYHQPNPRRLTMAEVKTGVNYALIINSNAGLWGYSLGDTVKFTSLNPHKLVVSGRLKHFISAFGEHVIGEEVEGALQEAMKEFPEVAVTEFTVAPYVSQGDGASYHEWFIAFDTPPHEPERFAKALNLHLRRRNSYYDDLISGNILACLKVTALPPDAFQQYMKRQGKLGGQNKVPRLSNDRALAEGLLEVCSL